MKRILLSLSLLLSFYCGFCQTNESGEGIIPYSVKIVDDVIKINEEVELRKGDKLLVFVPYRNQSDFLTIEKKEGLLSVKNLSKVTDIVGTGAVAVGLGSNNLNTSLGALEVLRKTTAVSYGLDVLNDINSLPISKNAKKIVGKDFEITKIESDGMGNIQLEGVIEKKKYTISLVEALMIGEVKLKN